MGYRVRAGDLPYLCEIQSENTTTVPTQWATFASVNGSVVFLFGRESFAASGFSSASSHLITIRFNPKLNIRAGMRVLCQRHTYTIQYVDDVELANVTLRLYALEIERNSC